MKIGTDEEDVISRIVRWANTQEPVRAVLLTSSRANRQALDILSDYDAALIVSDTEPYVQSDEWLHGVGTPLLRVRDTERVLGIEKPNCMVLYDDGTKVDYTIWSSALVRRFLEAGRLPDEFDVGYRVILDKDGLTPDLPRPTYTAHVPSKPTEQEFQDLIQECWWVTTYVAKYLWRDDLVPVKTLLDYELKFLLVRKLLEWRIEIDHDWSVKPGFFGRGLRKYLDADTWAHFEGTYVGPDRAANWAALYETIELFRHLAIEVGRALGYEYPHDLDARMMTYLRQIQRLDDVSRSQER